jgi:transcriptional regulator GlxA family with amidase domain
MPLGSRKDMVNIAIVLFPDAEELDWAGPWEVLAAWAQQFPDDGVRVYTVADDADTVRCAKGLIVQPEYTWDTAPAPDVVVWPGGIGTRRQLGDEHVRARVRGLASGGALMTSVCTGSLVYADAGLLDGRPATTYWSQLELLSSLGTDIDVQPEARFVDAGEVITGAGVSAGIDMALHLVARLHSVERARDVRKYIQYDPAPPV